MSAVTTHVLDAARGRPARGMGVRLQRVHDDAVVEIDRATTGTDGRVPGLGPDALEPGRYRLVFDTGSWFDEQAVVAFYPQVSLDFVVTAADEHYHVPLLLSPFAFSTYRGS